MPLLRVLALSFCVAIPAVAQDPPRAADSNDVPQRRHSIGSSLFLLGNLAQRDPPHFFLLNYGYELRRRSVVFAEAITWTYYEPLGTYGSSDKRYPGQVRAIGLGAGVKRFLWRNSYVTAQATPFLQQFLDTNHTELRRGFQLYLQSRAGYHFEFFRGRWFVEPSVAFNYWPINTNFPASFEQIENGARNYFLFEPGLHFGYRR